MELSASWLESVLDLQLNGERVIDVKKEPVAGKGVSNSSDLRRLKLQILGSGKERSWSVIVKQLPAAEHTAKKFNEWGVFRNEINVYRNILPHMADLMRQMKEEPLWGHCIFSRPYDLIIVEDLKELGYMMADRQKGLDLEHSAGVLSSLGKFHAMSVILRDRGLFDPANYSKCFFAKKDPLSIAMIQSFHDQSVDSLVAAIESYWEPEWLPFKEKFLHFKGKSLGLLAELAEGTNPKFLALNHGDCWTSNMLFKYGLTKCVIGHRFVDFQDPFHVSIGYDLTYFLSTSPTAEVIENHLDEILTSYFEAYKRTMERLRHESPILTLEEVKDELNRFSLLALTICGMSLPIMLSDPEDTPEKEDLFRELETGEKIKMSLKPFCSKVYMSKAQCILRWCVRNNLFDSFGS